MVLGGYDIVSAGTNYVAYKCAPRRSIIEPIM